MQLMHGSSIEFQILRRGIFSVASETEAILDNIDLARVSTQGIDKIWKNMNELKYALHDFIKAHTEAKKVQPRREDIFMIEQDDSKLLWDFFIRAVNGFR
ncbi:hypothetical protein HAX54_001221 [Datura stramonium]|uniref:Uncharacterized protein n=1 Tax=Datura stramonium TaxID=4076 RepID=A0ABS8T223_DATST|nr:hypothetical protein [Datura stramonium]